MRFPFGQSATVRRWSSWTQGEAQGNPREWVLPAVARAPLEIDDPAGRRGVVIPGETLLFAFDDELAPHDLVTFASGATLEVTGPVKRYEHPLTGWRAGATAHATELVEVGPESVLVYLSQELEDVYGSIERVPVDEPVQIDHVTVEPLSSPEDMREGQSADPRYRITGRGLEVLDAYAEVEWPIGSGRRFEIDGFPLRWPWPRATPYTQATLRERR